MIKKACIVVVVIIAIVGIYVMLKPSEPYKREEEYFRGIYSVIKDRSFDNGKFDNGELVLYNSSFDVLERISVTENQSHKLVRIIKDADAEQIYFIMGGAVDDQYGIVFTKGSSINMDGIHSLKRISGNSYYYASFAD